MGSWQLEMVSCRSCKRCLSGVKTHGPYWFEYVRKKNGELTSYYRGKASGSQALRVDNYEEVAARVERMQTQAEDDYRRAEERMTSRQEKQHGIVLALLSRLKLKERDRRKDESQRVEKAEAEGLGARAVAELKRELKAQFALEVKELKAQVKKERYDLMKMLGAA